MDGLKVPFRSSSQLYSLESFSFRFVRGSSMRPSPPKETDLPLADIAVKVTSEGSAAAAKAAREAASGGGGGGGSGGGDTDVVGALLDSSATEEQVR